MPKKERGMATLNVERHSASRLTGIHYAEELVLRKRKSNEIPMEVLFKHASRGSRRRAASHRPRRYPVKLRLKLATSAAAAAFKKSNRRRRRRQGNYISGCTTTNSTDSKHLPTHKWHGKRFHFSEGFLWDMKIPSHSMERSERSTVKTECQQCTAHDASYMQCFQLIGQSDCFKKAKIAEWKIFSSNFDFDNGYTKDIEVFNKTGNLVAVVDTFFHAYNNNNNSLNTTNIFVFVHTSAFNEVKELFNQLTDKHIILYDCTNEIGQIDIYGPKSNQILNQIITPHVFNPSSSSSILLSKILRIDRPASVPGRFSMELIVRDPRCNVRNITSKSSSSNINSSTTNLPTIFSKNNRIRASKRIQATSDNYYNEQRRKGKLFQSNKRSKIENNDSEVLVPILLIRHSLSGKVAKYSHKTLGEGWKIILPFGAVQTLWHALVSNNRSNKMVLPVGTRHCRSVSIFLNKPTFPYDYPETNAGNKWYTYLLNKKNNQHSPNLPHKWLLNNVTEFKRIKITCIKRGGKLINGALICLPNTYDILHYTQYGKKYTGGTHQEDNKRIVIGNVTSGSTSYARSPKGIGIGIIKDDTIKHLFYMIKNPSSPYYRPIQIEILNCTSRKRYK